MITIIGFLKIRIIKWVEKANTVFFYNSSQYMQIFPSNLITCSIFFSTKIMIIIITKNTSPSISVRAQASSAWWSSVSLDWSPLTRSAAESGKPAGEGTRTSDPERPPQRPLQRVRVEDLQPSDSHFRPPPPGAPGPRGASSAAGAGGGVGGRWGGGVAAVWRSGPAGCAGSQWAEEEALATPRGREQADPSSEHLPGHPGFLGWGSPGDSEHGPRGGNLSQDALSFVCPALEYLSSGKYLWVRHVF